MNMNEFMTIPGTTYIVTPDLKIINSKTNKENRCTNISVLMDDGLRHGFRRERLIYAAKNNINPLHIPKYIIVNKNGDGMERYDFYKKHKRGSVKCRYPFDVNEYEKLIEGDYVYNGEIGDIALSGSVTFLRKGGEDGCL